MSIKSQISSKTSSGKKDSTKDAIKSFFFLFSRSFQERRYLFYATGFEIYDIYFFIFFFLMICILMRKKPNELEVLKGIYKNFLIFYARQNPELNT